jgi:hypothetical protein
MSCKYSLMTRNETDGTYITVNVKKKKNHVKNKIKLEESAHVVIFCSLKEGK